MGDKAVTPESLGLTPVEDAEGATPESLGLSPASMDPAELATLKKDVPAGVYAESRGLDAMATTENPNYVSLDSRVNESPMSMLGRSFAETGGPAAAAVAGGLRGIPFVGGFEDEMYGTGKALFTDQSFEDARKEARGALDAAVSDYPLTAAVADIAAGVMSGAAIKKFAQSLDPARIKQIAKLSPQAAKIIKTVLRAASTTEGRIAGQAIEGARRGFAESERESFLGTLGDMYLMTAMYAVPTTLGAAGSKITKNLKDSNTTRAASKARASLEDRFRSLWGSTTKELQETTAAAYAKGETLEHVMKNEAEFLKTKGIDIAGKTRDEIGIALNKLQSEASQEIQNSISAIDAAMPKGLITPKMFSDGAELMLQNAKSAGGAVQAGRAAKLLKDEAKFLSANPEKATAEALQDIRKRLSNTGWEILHTPSKLRSDAEPYFAALNMVDSMMEEAAKAVDGVAGREAGSLYKTLSEARKTWGVSGRMLLGAAKPEKKTASLLRSFKSWVVDSAGEKTINGLVNTISSDKVAQIAAASAKGPRAVVALCYSLRRTAKTEKEKKLYEEFMRNVSTAPANPQNEEDITE